MAEAKQQDAAAAAESTEELSLLDQIVQRGRFAKDETTKARGVDLIKRFVSEITEGAITISADKIGRAHV